MEAIGSRPARTETSRSFTTRPGVPRPGECGGGMLMQAVQGYRKSTLNFIGFMFSSRL